MSHKMKPLNAAIQRKLTEVAAALTETAPHLAQPDRHSTVLAREFLCPAKQLALRGVLEDFEDQMFATYDDEFGYPWGMPRQALIHLSWESRMPGGGDHLEVDAVTLPGGQRLYVHHADDGISPFVLAISASVGTPRIDALFLQQLFRSNGKCFGIGPIVETLPDYVSTDRVWSFPFLVDIFRVGLDACGPGAWKGLLEAYGNVVWNEGYENPEPPFDLSPDRVNKHLAAIDAERGPTGGFTNARLRHEEARAWAEIIRDETPDLLHAMPDPHTPMDDVEKPRIVARYLAKVVQVGGPSKENDLRVI